MKQTDRPSQIFYLAYKVCYDAEINQLKVFALVPLFSFIISITHGLTDFKMYLLLFIISFCFKSLPVLGGGLTSV